MVLLMSRILSAPTLLEVFGARSSVSVNQQIVTENDGVILWLMEVCLCFYLLALTLSPLKMNPDKYQV